MADQWQTGVIPPNAADVQTTPNELTVLTDGSIAGANLVTNQNAAIGTSATLIVAARPGIPGVGRKNLTITNTGSSPVFIGNAGVTAATGTEILPGTSRDFITFVAIYGVVASGTGSVDYVEIF